MTIPLMTTMNIGSPNDKLIIPLVVVCVVVMVRLIMLVWVFEITVVDMTIDGNVNVVEVSKVSIEVVVEFVETVCVEVT